MVALSLFICSFVHNYLLFFVLYAFMVGCGFGLIYMLPLKIAWLYYPKKKGMISGLILSCYSVGAIIWIIITTSIANPNNQTADLIIVNGDDHEKLYGPDSDVVKNVP